MSELEAEEETDGEVARVVGIQTIAKDQDADAGLTLHRHPQTGEGVGRLHLEDIIEIHTIMIDGIDAENECNN